VQKYFNEFGIGIKFSVFFIFHTNFEEKKFLGVILEPHANFLNAYASKTGHFQTLAIPPKI
jgi:hypothetical protein